MADVLGLAGVLDGQTQEADDGHKNQESDDANRGRRSVEAIRVAEEF